MTTIAEIKAQMTDAFIANETVKKRYNLQSGKTFEEQFSSVSLESIIFFVVATCYWSLTQLFTLHKTEVTEIVADQKFGTRRWYAWIARQFQYGQNLDAETDEYDNTGLTAEQIAERRIVSYSAVVKREKTLYLKVAKAEGKKLVPLTADELTAFTEYMDRKMIAGDNLIIVNQEADRLRLTIDVYFNPLVLNAQGQRLDGTSLTPVSDAVYKYLQELPFNGELVLAFLTDALQAVDGVVIPEIRIAQYRYAATDWLNIDVKYQPYSGYFEIENDSDLVINYIAQSDII